MPGDLLERSALLAEFRGALAGSVSSGQVLLAAGEPGTGKSALVRSSPARPSAPAS